MKKTFTLTEGSEYIELVKLLKLLRITEIGSDGKDMVREEMILVNGEKEYRFKRKLRKNDHIQIPMMDIEIEIL